MSDLNYNYLINKALHPGGEEHQIAKSILDIRLLTERVNASLFFLPLSVQDVKWKEWTENFQKIERNLWTLHKALTDHNIPF